MRVCAMQKWLLWIPVLMTAALVYWTVALGLGGLSLVAVSSMSASTQLPCGSMEPAESGAGSTSGVAAGEDSGGGGVGAPRDGFEPILVRIEESAEPEDVDDNDGSGHADEVAPSLTAPAEAEEEWRFDPGPGHIRGCRLQHLLPSGLPSGADTH